MDAVVAVAVAITAALAVVAVVALVNAVDMAVWTPLWPWLWPLPLPSRRGRHGCGGCGRVWLRSGSAVGEDTLAPQPRTGLVPGRWH